MSMTNQDTLQERIMKKIQAHQVVPRSRAYFIFLGVVTILVLVLVFGALFFLFSFIIAMIRESGGVFLSEFGFHGFRLLFFSLPWLLIVAAFILFFVLQFATRRFRFAYRRPMLITLFGVALIVLSGSVILAQTRLHRRALEVAHRGNLPIFGPIYRHYGIRHHPDFLVGSFQWASGTTFSIQMRDGEERVVILTSSTRFREPFLPQEGDMIFALGKEMSEGFTAYGIKRVFEGDVFVPQKMKRMNRLPSQAPFLP